MRPGVVLEDKVGAHKSGSEKRMRRRRKKKREKKKKRPTGAVHKPDESKGKKKKSKRLPPWLTRKGPTQPQNGLVDALGHHLHLRGRRLERARGP